MTIPADGYQYSMVLKVTHRDFENWVYGDRKPE